MQFNNMEIVASLHLDPHFLPQLFQLLTDHGPGDSEWPALVAFLQVGTRHAHTYIELQRVYVS